VEVWDCCLDAWVLVYRLVHRWKRRLYPIRWRSKSPRFRTEGSIYDVCVALRYSLECRVAFE